MSQPWCLNCIFSAARKCSRIREFESTIFGCKQMIHRRGMTVSSPRGGRCTSHFHPLRQLSVINAYRAFQRVAKEPPGSPEKCLSTYRTLCPTEEGETMRPAPLLNLIQWVMKMATIMRSVRRSQRGKEGPGRRRGFALDFKWGSE